jgi:acyl-CoA thioesterase-1
VVLCLGGNDMLRKEQRDTMQTNFAEMIEIIQENGLQELLLGVPAPALFNLNADPRCQQLANQYAIPLENQIISAVLSKQSLKSDPIHPNNAGYKKIAEAIATLLNQAGAI